jgi:uncharacterized protein YceK
LGFYYSKDLKMMNNFLIATFVAILFSGCSLIDFNSNSTPTQEKKVESKKIDNKINWKYCEDMDYDGSNIIEQ